MQSFEGEREPQLLHLGSGGIFSRHVDRLLERSGLRAELCSDPFAAMGWLANRGRNRPAVVLVDCASLSGDEREFPSLALRLAATGAVYLYGDAEALGSDAAMTRCGARVITTPEQLDDVVAEIEQRLSRSARGCRPRREDTAAALPGLAPPEDAGPMERIGGFPESTAAPASAPLVELPDNPATPAPDDAATVNPNVDALAEAASKNWDRPVLDVTDDESNAIARILPELEPDEEPEDADQPAGNEVPTPWSPSQRRPERKPPAAQSAEPPADKPRTCAPAEESGAPILTPEELDALLGRRETG